MMQTYKERLDILSKANKLSDVEVRNTTHKSPFSSWKEARDGSGLFEDFCEIRLKPKPKLIPWTCETAPDNLMIRKDHWSKGCYFQVNVASYGIWHLDTCGDEQQFSYQELLDDWQQRDQSPCGTLEEN